MNKRVFYDFKKKIILIFLMSERVSVSESEGN